MSSPPGTAAGSSKRDGGWIIKVLTCDIIYDNLDVKKRRNYRVHPFLVPENPEGCAPAASTG
jgi:hypothetical protein